MKILIISGYFFPTITPRAFRTTELVKELVTRNHDVTVCVPNVNFSYDSFKSQYKCRVLYISEKPLDLSLPKGKNLFSIGIRYLYSFILKYTQYPFIKVCKYIPQLASKLEEHYDLLISIAAPHPIHWGVSKLMKRNSKLANVWIADCGDPFMGDSVNNNPFYFKSREMEFCAGANFITVPIAEAIGAYYPPFRDKIKVIPQGFDFTPFENIEKEYVKHDVPTFAYAGSLYRGYRDLTSFVNYLAIKNENFLFVLYTKRGVLVDSYKRKLGNRIRILPLMPREGLIKELSKMDFLVNIENKSNVQLPSKLIDYGLTKRPILSVSNSLDESLVDEFLEGKYSRKLEIGDLSVYDIKNVVDSFLNLCNTIAK